ncbi:MAG: hypothetical protein V4671_09970 [Armatimonadota bacterium]
MNKYITEDRVDRSVDSTMVRGHEPLPEPYESAARMVQGDRLYNEAVVARREINGGLLHRWRQRPEIVARARYLARSQRQQTLSGVEHSVSVSR